MGGKCDRNETACLCVHTSGVKLKMTKKKSNNHCLNVKYFFMIKNGNLACKQEIYNLVKNIKPKIIILKLVSLVLEVQKKAIIIKI